jgi:NADP-dependent aldehyde dehydrogenase
MPAATSTRAPPAISLHRDCSSPGPSELTSELLEECFGPLVVVATYDDVERLDAVLGRIPPSLTATIHYEDGDGELVGRLFRTLERKAAG